MENLPQIINEDTDLIDHVKKRRGKLKITQLDADIIAGNQDGYTSKLEGAHRHYGRVPTGLTRPLQIKFTNQDGNLQVTGLNCKRNIITASASWWLGACNLSLVLMDKAQAESLCNREIPYQISAQKAKSGIVIRKLSINMEIKDCGYNQAPVEAIDANLFHSIAQTITKAQVKNKVSGLSAAIVKARSAGIDYEALKVALSMTPQKAIELSNHLARVAAYLNWLNNKDVKVVTMDCIEYVKDEVNPAQVHMLESLANEGE